MTYVETSPIHQSVAIRVMGQWLPVAWTGDQEEDPQPRAIEHVSMGGNRSMTTLPSRLRSWTTSGGGMLRDWRNLQRIAGGEFGAGPFEMIRPLAARTNMVATKGDIGGVSAGMSIVDGEPHRVYSTPVQTEPFPVFPGVALTARAIQVGGTMRLSWYDQSGALLASQTAGGAGSTAWTTVTGTAPLNATHARVVPFGAALAGAAQVRLSIDDDGVYYAPAGVRQVAVVPGSSSHDWINVATVHATPMSSTVTIFEVEPA